MTNDSHKKRILYVITKSNFGGAQRYVFELAVAMKERGHTVHVAFGGVGRKHSIPGKLEAMLHEANIQTFRVNHFMRNVSLLDDIHAFFELRNIIKQVQPDVLHVTSSKAGALGALAGRTLRIPRIIFTAHGLTDQEVWRPAWQRFFILIATWKTILLSHTSIMISSATERRARAFLFCKNKIALVHNGLKPQSFLPTIEAREKLGLENLPENAVVIGTIAELHSNKNLGVVLEALYSTKGTDYLHFVVIGSGELEEELVNMVDRYNLKERVHFLGFKNDAAQYVKAFDIFILPSYKEGLPYAVLEAGAAAIPVIASNIDGHTDIITHKKSGLLFNPKNTAELGHILRTQTTNRAQLQEYGTALQHVVDNTFSFTHMIDETESVYTGT